MTSVACPTYGQAKTSALRERLTELALGGCDGDHGHNPDDCPTADCDDCGCISHVAGRALALHDSERARIETLEGALRAIARNDEDFDRDARHLIVARGALENQNTKTQGRRMTTAERNAVVCDAVERAQEAWLTLVACTPSVAQCHNEESASRVRRVAESVSLMISKLKELVP